MKHSRHTLATEILSKGGSGQGAADVLGNSPLMIRKHYAKWNVQREDRIKSLMQTVHSGTFLAQKEKAAVIVKTHGWPEACKRAGLPCLLFHDLRRSAVRNMKRAGIQDRVAMEISGHRTRSIFDRYNIVDEADLVSAGKRLEEYSHRRKQERAAPSSASSDHLAVSHSKEPLQPAAAKAASNRETATPDRYKNSSLVTLIPQKALGL